MSDGFALAALSFALRTRVQQFINDATDVAQLGPFDIVTRSPEQLASTNPTRVAVTIYPWRLVANPGWASSRGASYGPSGDRRASPLLALDAYYILAGYAPANGDADTILGWVLLALHETPQISRDLLQALSAGVNPNTSPLKQALRDLAEQDAPITIQPVSNELEDFSQVWSSLNSGARTGMVYRVGTLLMESRRRAAPGLPVREARLSVLQLRAPRILRMSFAANTAGPFSERAFAVPGEVVRLEGVGLQGDITQVAIGDRVVAVDPTRLRSDRLDADLPGDLRPGVSALQVRHQWHKPPHTLPPAAAGTIVGASSNLVPLAIRPVLRDANPLLTDNRQTDAEGVVSFDVTVQFAVAVGNLQTVELLLNATVADSDGRFASFVFSAARPAPGVVDAAVVSRTVKIAGVVAGDYLTRVVVDGAESALRENAQGVNGPILTVPA